MTKAIFGRAGRNNQERSHSSCWAFKARKECLGQRFGLRTFHTGDQSQQVLDGGGRKGESNWHKLILFILFLINRVKPNGEKQINGLLLPQGSSCILAASQASAKGTSSSRRVLFSCWKNSLGRLYRSLSNGRGAHTFWTQLTGYCKSPLWARTNELPEPRFLEVVSG